MDIDRYRVHDLQIPNDLWTLKNTRGGAYTLREIHYGLSLVSIPQEVEAALSGAELLAGYAGTFRFRIFPKPKWYTPRFLGEALANTPSTEPSATPKSAPHVLADVIDRGLGLPGLASLQRGKHAPLSERLLALDERSKELLASSLNPPSSIRDPLDPNAGYRELRGDLYVRSVADLLRHHVSI